jgi:hypothetical protein
MGRERLVDESPQGRRKCLTREEGEGVVSLTGETQGPGPGRPFIWFGLLAVLGSTFTSRKRALGSTDWDA